MAQDEHSHKLPGGVGPFATIGLGVLTSVGVGWAVGAEAHQLFLHYSDGGVSQFNGVAFWSPFLIAGEETFRNGYWHNIPPGWRGVPTFLGRRLSWFLLSEGKHWLPPGIMGVIMVDCREQEARMCKLVHGEDALASDGIEMGAEFYWAYQIIDPYLYESKEHPLRILDSVGLGAVRNAIAGSASATLIQKDERSKISEDLKRGMQAAGGSLGIEVTRAGVTKMLPPQTVIDANAKKAEEGAKRDAEKVRFENIKNRVAQLKSLGFTPNEAYFIHAAETGSIPTNKQIREFGISEAVSKPVLEMLERVLSRPRSV